MYFHSPAARDNTVVKYLFVLHADPCNKSYMSRKISIESPSVGLAALAQLYVYIYVRGQKNISPFQTFVVGPLVEFIHRLYHCVLQKRFPHRENRGFS